MITFSDALPIQFWTPDCDTYNESEFEGVFPRCFCQPFECTDTITIQFKDTPGYTRTLRIVDENETPVYSSAFTGFSNGIYQKSVVPINDGFCNKNVRFEILAGSTVLAKSDCISVKTDHPETVLIYYHNNRVFSSLNSSVGTPDPQFYLRIPAIFFRERYPKTTEIIDLSNSQSVQTMAEIKYQRLLQIKNMPAYMHLKTQLVLSFQNVTISGLEWIAQEPYEPVEASTPRWPMNKAQIWLNRKNYITRNVL
jgi:hypothetical protein